MRRWALLFLMAVLPASTALGSDIAVRRPAVRAAAGLPPGLPRAHYNYRTTIAPPYPARRPYVVPVVDEPDLLFTPYAPLVSAPLLPGSAALPGYYGRPGSYYYQGPYYGGPYEPYWNRLPYACGVYGYC